MRVLNVTTITDASQFPVKSGTLQFLQDMNSELFKGMAIALIGPATYDPTQIYIFSGVTNSLVSPNYNIASGFAFYAGEFFYINAAAFAVSGSNTAICQLSTTQYDGNGLNADPVTFTDNSVQNVHNIRMIAVVQGASGSGINDFASLKYVSFSIPKQFALTASTAVPHADNIAQLTGIYPNIDIYVPSSTTNNHPILACGNKNVGDVSSGSGTTVTITFASVSTTAYSVVMSIRSLGDPTHDVLVAYAVVDGSQTDTGFQVHFQELAAQVQDISLDWAIVKQ